MRLFIAVRLATHVREALVSVQTALRSCGMGGQFVREENLHLTLAFIGEYSDPERVLDAMEAVPFAPFPICLEGFGNFGSLYWCGVEGGEALPLLVKRLRRSLGERGIPFDRKRFLPHVTMVRRAEVGGRGLPGVVIPAAGMEVRAISLMRSDRGKSGMLYTEVGRVCGRETG